MERSVVGTVTVIYINSYIYVYYSTVQSNCTGNTCSSIVIVM